MRLIIDIVLPLCHYSVYQAIIIFISSRIYSKANTSNQMKIVDFFAFVSFTIQIFFHKFFREKAERDRVRGVVHPKKSNKNASEGDEKLGRRGSKKRRGADDDLEEFTVDNTADEKQGLGVMDFDEDEDAEEEVCWVITSRARVCVCVYLLNCT